ncbi:MAG: YHS domain-containing protein [Chloroflexota bacterium]
MDEEKKEIPGIEQERESLVCRRVMTTTRESYYQAEYQGRIIYFCTEFCLESFKADPDRFYTAHNRIKS